MQGTILTLVENIVRKINKLNMLFAVFTILRKLQVYTDEKETIGLQLWNIKYLWSECKRKEARAKMIKWMKSDEYYFKAQI